MLKNAKDNVMITGDALLDFGDGHKIKRGAKPGWYIYHSLPASHQAIFSCIRLEKWRYDLEYKVSSDYAGSKMYKAGYAFKTQYLVSEFSMGGVSTTNNMELCADAKSQRQILHVHGFGLNYPAFTPTYYIKKKAIITKSEYRKPMQDLSGFSVPKGFGRQRY